MTLLIPWYYLNTTCWYIMVMLMVWSSYLNTGVLLWWYFGDNCVVILSQSGDTVIFDGNGSCLNMLTWWYVDEYCCINMLVWWYFDENCTICTVVLPQSVWYCDVFVDDFGDISPQYVDMVKNNDANGMLIFLSRICQKQVFGQTDPNNPGLPVKLSSAAVAGFTAAAFSLPFDMLKSRLQVRRRKKPIVFRSVFP